MVFHFFYHLDSTKHQQHVQIGTRGPEHSHEYSFHVVRMQQGRYVVHDGDGYKKQQPRYCLKEERDPCDRLRLTQDLDLHRSDQAKINTCAKHVNTSSMPVGQPKVGGIVHSCKRHGLQFQGGVKDDETVYECHDHPFYHFYHAQRQVQ